MPTAQRWGCGYGCRTPYRARLTEEGYSVEFFDMTGNTVAVVTVPASVFGY
jgi:hypothetical protein